MTTFVLCKFFQGLFPVAETGRHKGVLAFFAERDQVPASGLHAGVAENHVPRLAKTKPWEAVEPCRANAALLASGRGSSSR